MSACVGGLKHPHHTKPVHQRAYRAGHTGPDDYLWPEIVVLKPTNPARYVCGHMVGWVERFFFIRCLLFFLRDATDGAQLHHSLLQTELFANGCKKPSNL